MKQQLIKTLSFATFALSLSSFTGCIIVLGGDDGGHGWPEPDPTCIQAPIACGPGSQVIRVGMTDDGCPIDECVAIACDNHSDCDGPDLACLPSEACTALTVEGGDAHCEKTCQFTAHPPVNLCEDVDCGEGYVCVIEDPCDNESSPSAVECEERAACVPAPELEPIETDPEDNDPQETDPQEEDTEEIAACYGDWDCEEGERCVFPAEESLEEDINCGAYIAGTCVSTLF